MSRRVYKGQHISASGTEILRDGALAVDLTTNRIYIHNGSTPGGNLLESYVKYTFKSATFTAEVGKLYVCDSGPYDVELPASALEGEWFDVGYKDQSGGQVAVQTDTPVDVGNNTIRRFIYNGADWITFPVSSN